MAALEFLPRELVDGISENLESNDLLSLRSTSRAIYNSTLHQFVHRFIRGRSLIIQPNRDLVAFKRFTELPYIRDRLERVVLAQESGRSFIEGHAIPPERELVNLLTISLSNLKLNKNLEAVEIWGMFKSALTAVKLSGFDKRIELAVTAFELGYDANHHGAYHITHSRISEPVRRVALHPCSPLDHYMDSTTGERHKNKTLLRNFFQFAQDTPELFLDGCAPSKRLGPRHACRSCLSIEKSLSNLLFPRLVMLKLHGFYINRSELSQFILLQSGTLKDLEMVYICLTTGSFEEIFRTLLSVRGLEKLHLGRLIQRRTKGIRGKHTRGDTPEVVVCENIGVAPFLNDSIQFFSLVLGSNAEVDLLVIPGISHIVEPEFESYGV